MAFPSDYSIVGTVLALAVAILLLSGLALYVAFRIRETLKDEKGGSARAAKVAFLIGLLFLSGGVFYFFASGFNAGAGGSSTLGTSSVSTSTGASSSASTTGSTTSSSHSTTSVSSSSTTTSSSSSSTSAQPGSVSMPAPSCPSRVTAGSTFTCTISIYNQGAFSYSSATIVSSGDFAKFTILACTESVNGGSPTSVPASANSIAVGNLVPGATVLTVTVQAPSQSGQYSNNVLTLDAPGLSQPVSVTFTVQVTA